MIINFHNATKLLYINLLGVCPFLQATLKIKKKHLYNNKKTSKSN